MKKIVQFSLIALIVSFTACSDATDIVQESELSEDLAFQTVADLQSGLNGVYASYAPDAGGNGGGDSVIFNDLFTDNLKSGLSNNGQGSQVYGFIIQPGTSFANSIWASRYSAINRANRVLRAYNRIFPNLTGDDIIAAQQIKGQLLALRALCHFDLFEYFTPDYYNPAGLAVIKMDFVPPSVESFYQRNTVAEIVDFVNSDIQQAYDLLGEVNETETGFIRINTVKALECRVAVVTGNYTLARTLAEEILVLHPTATKQTYPNMFNRSGGVGVGTTAPAELIFSLIRLPSASGGVAALYYPNEVSAEGLPFFEASKQLYDLYLDGDVRKVVNFDEDSDGINLILVGKYQGTAQNELSNDFPVFRSSEMQLIKAECEARAGDLAASTNSIRALRIRRYGSSALAPPTPEFENLTVALTEILLERRKEFAFEGHRYLDLKRLGGELNIGINRLESDAESFSAPAGLPANDYRFTLPIPQNELNSNDIITQNPDYPAN